MPKLRLCFAGTPAFAAAHLEVLLDSPHSVVAVYTQPDRPAGRGKKMQASAVKQLALAHGIPVKQPQSLKSAAEEQALAGLQPDLLIVVAYGLILPEAILAIPRYGCLNVHASLLPRWRGAAPIERALLAGDTETGVTIMQMDAGLDTGDMLTTETIPITDTDTRVDLEARLAEAGARALLRTLDNLPTLQANAVKQDDTRSTYANKLDKAEALIHWDQRAELISRQIRAGVGRTPAFCFLDGQRLRLLDATVLAEGTGAAPGTIVAADKSGLQIACLDSQLLVHTVQLAGKNAMGIGALLNSRPELFAPGTRLRSSEPATR